VNDPAKRSLAIEAAEAIDPTLQTSSVADVATAIDPTFRDRALQLIADYQHGLDAGAPRTTRELVELKTLLLGDAGS
jgi:hypothetical protein